MPTIFFVAMLRNCPLPSDLKSSYANAIAPPVKFFLKMACVELLDSYCFVFLFFAFDAMSLSSTNIRIQENCINGALFRIFGSCDKSSLEYIKICTGLHHVEDLVGKRHCSSIDKLISHVRFSNVLLVYGSNVLYKF